MRAPAATQPGAAADFWRLPRRRQDGGQGVPFRFWRFDFPISSTAPTGRKSGGSGGFRDISAQSSAEGKAPGEARRKAPKPGTDLEYQVNVPFWTAIRGGVMR